MCHFRHLLRLNMPNRLSMFERNEDDTQGNQRQGWARRQRQIKGQGLAKDAGRCIEALEGEQMKRRYNRRMKKCPLCKQTKRRDSAFYKDSTRNGHCAAYCKACQLKRAKKYRAKHRKRIIRWLAEYRAVNPDRVKSAVLKNVHGLTLEQFRAMTEKQKCRCAICGKHHDNLPAEGTRHTRFVVDHDHATGKIRELLCGPCNRRIDHKATPALLRKSADYLEKHSTLTIN